MVLLDFLYGQEFLKKVPPGLFSKSFFFLIFLPYLDNYLLLGRPILKLIRHLSMDEQTPTIKYGQMAYSFKFIVEK